MKRTALTCAALFAFCVLPAQAEEVLFSLPHDWSGFYAGMTAGYGRGSIVQYDHWGDSGEQRLDGSAVGLQAGYNWQLDNIVLGVEADFQKTNLDGLFGYQLMRWGCGWVACSGQVDWFATARLRAGYATENLLPYVTAGLAYGDVRSEIHWESPDWQRADLNFGWSAGAGLDISLSPRLSTRLEYLYTDLGTTSADGAYDFAGSADFSLMRLGLNYAFGADRRWKDGMTAIAGPHDWSGLYAGLNGGYAYGSQVQHDVGGSSAAHRVDGPAGGVQLGYNWLFDRMMLGIEGDMQLASVEGTFGTDWEWFCVWFGCRTETDWFATARLRAGYATDDFLAYVTGGAAYGGVSSEITWIGHDWQLDDRQLGWVAGAGVEVALSKKLSARLEYLYLDFGRTSEVGYFDFSASTEFGITRAGLNYAF